MSPAEGGRGCRPAPARVMVGIIDTGVNPWHSHVGGRVCGVGLVLGADRRIRESEDFHDPVGHGTAVAGVLRQALPDAELFAVRAFDSELRTYPSLVARGILRAAGAGCQVINLSLGLTPGAGAEVVAEACRWSLAAGVILVGVFDPKRPALLPAALPGVVGAQADARLAPCAVIPAGPDHYRAAGQPRDLHRLPPGSNLRGASFACARVSAHLARAHAVGTNPLLCPPGSMTGNR